MISGWKGENFFYNFLNEGQFFTFIKNYKKYFFYNIEFIENHILTSGNSMYISCVSVAEIKKRSMSEIAKICIYIWL